MESILHLPNLYSAFRILGLNYAKSQHGWDYPSHSHAYFEFLYCVSGSMLQTVNGLVYEIKAGDAILIKAGTLHSTKTPEESIWFDFHFDVEMKELYEVLLKITNPIISAANGNWESQVTLQAWVEKLINELASGHEGSTADNLTYSLHVLTLQAHLLEFISMIANHYHSQSLLQQVGQPYSNQFALAHKVAKFMEQSLGQHPMKIYEIAKHLNVHRSYLSDCFHKVYGMSPRNYSAQVRMREAKRLLQETDLPIEHIAELLHYSSSSHFCQAFRQITGQTPKQFRHHI